MRRTLVETCTVRNTQSIEALCPNQIKELEQQRMDSDLLEGLGKAKAALQNHFETKRLAVVGPGKDCDGRFLKTHDTLD